MDELIRINKYIAECGICSRREADRLIEAGRVTINGKVSKAGDKVTGLEEIIVDGKKLKSRNKKVVLAYYKPVGVVCTERDEHAEMTIKDAFDYPIRVTYAGRLDKDSEGLLLLTNDGDLIDKLMRGKNGHEKEYIVRVSKELPVDFKEKMEAGIFLRELNVKTKPCRVFIEDSYTFRIILTEGLNRQIRRMCESFGLNVIRLKRLRVANIEIGKLAVGTYRKLTNEELITLKNSLA